MRRPRWRRPNQYLEMTIRCHHSEMRLVPAADRVQVIGFWMAKGLARFRGIQVLAICQMSNHLHLIICDREGEASSFMQYVDGFIAKAINRIDGRRGAVFEHRFAEIPIIEEEKLPERIAYVACNPVAAKLVRSIRDWTGLCGFAGAEPRSRKFTRFREDLFQKAADKAQAKGQPPPERDQFIEAAVLEMAVVEPGLAAATEAAVNENQAELQAMNKSFLGMPRVLAQSPFDRPKHSKRSPLPLCFAATREARAAFIDGWRTFVRIFRTASGLFRAGNFNAAFPAHCFRPAPD